MRSIFIDETNLAFVGNGDDRAWGWIVDLQVPWAFNGTKKTKKKKGQAA